MTLSPLGEGCGCVAQHAPSAYVLVHHHVLPQSWGGLTVPGNLVPICSNTHDSVHRLIDEHVRYGGVPPWEVRQHYSVFQRGLAARAWGQRPAKPTYTLHVHLHSVK